ncbi:MAG: hypothetical protein E6Q97_11345 [Desulfurellales bacterium]|nr:MAG: hypothetical protein E6Q97_11345 [Desulfurellales bacterium]
MSRPESQALGGFFKTQDEVRPLIYRHFAQQTAAGSYCVVDPCAGEGEAVYGCIDAVFGTKRADDVRIALCAVELEAERYAAMQSARWGHRLDFSLCSIHQGDGLCCEAKGDGASLLWLNPPYDFFRGQRFEARFLDAWTPRLIVGGQLVLIVPEHALSYLTATLTTWFDDLDVLRYPEPTYAEFKQVVVLGTKRALVGEVGTLPPVGDLAALPASLRHVPCGELAVDVNNLDVTALRAATNPWGTAATVAAGYGRPAQPPQIGLAMRPKPAHIAMALGSGVFNGVRLSAPGRPDLLAKAVFIRRFVDQDVKLDDKGEVAKLTQVERPQLRLTVLDLSTGEYRELSPGTEPSNSGVVENFADLLLAYGDGMVAAMRERCPSLHNGEEDIALPTMRRMLFPAQASASRAALKLMARGETPLILGELGSGKTSVAIQTMYALTTHDVQRQVRALRVEHETAFAPLVGQLPLVRRVLVVCPPHLAQNWIDEMKACLPAVPVRVLDSTRDVDAVSEGEAPLLLAILSRETAKLGHGVSGVASAYRNTRIAHIVRCPRCGAPLPASEAEKRGKGRQTCEGTLAEPLDALARLGRDMTALRRRTPYDKPSFNYFRRAALAPLLWRLRRLLRERGYSKEHSAAIDATIAAVKLCTPHPRVLRILKRLMPGHTYNGVHSPDHRVSGFAFSAKLENNTLCRALCDMGRWRVETCGEPLYQATPQPRRFPLAEYITRRYPKLFQLLIADEFHEYSTDGSAQEKALHRLTEKIPLVLPLTGSLMNGYAKSLFRNLWAVSRRMRAEFGYADGGKFAKLYGYQKRILTGDAAKAAKVAEYGASSDRVVKTEGGERMQDAPGVLPSFVLRHVLPLSVTLHKRDITPDDRVVDHDRAEIAITDAEHARNGAALGAALKAAVKRDRFDEKLAGRLFGQLAEYPSYYDRATADTGNAGPADARRFDIAYPEAVGGAIVASAEGLPAAQWMAKEEWLRAMLRRELDEGRNVLIFLWHKELADRLQKLCRSVGETPAFLDAAKVPAKKRQDWIDKHVVGKRRILITNPSCVQTGLNNLIWFASAVFVENPGCNPFVARQAVGRLDRITQTKEVRIYWPVYEGVQCAMLDLLQAKTAISQQIDGIDPSAALEMAGAGDGSEVQALDVGLAVYRYLGGD